MLLGPCAALSNEELTCKDLKRIYLREGYLEPNLVLNYCYNRCKFLPGACKKGDLKPSSFSVPAMPDVLAPARKFLAEYDEVAFSEIDDGFAISERLADIWVHMIWRMWALALGFIPVVLNQWKAYGLWRAVLCLLTYVIIMFCQWCPTGVAVHNIVYAMLCLVMPASSPFLAESLFTTSIMVVLAFAMFISDPAVQVVILLASVVGFFWYMYWIFLFKRNQASNSVVVMCIQVYVLLEQLHYARVNNYINTIGSIGLEMFLNALWPNGYSHFHFRNVMSLSARLAVKDGAGTFSFAIFVTFVAIQLVMWFVTRSFVGSYCILSLRYKFTAGTVIDGFIIHCCDFYGGPSSLFRLVFYYEKPTMRRIGYAVVRIIMLIVDFHAAREVFLLVFVCSTIDKMFIRSAYGKMQHQLAFNLDFMQSSFPKEGAPAWCSLTELARISEFVGVLYADMTGGITRRGLGVVLRSGGSDVLYTVKHVIRGASRISFFTKEVVSPNFVDVTTHEDPLVAMKLPFHGTPECSLLAKSDIEFINYLVFIGCDETSGSEKMICMIPKFELKHGMLSAAVNLRKGDSGGPCFAVLWDGTVKLCGVVSRGTAVHGGGNIISFAYADAVDELDSSDEESEELSSPRVGAFNAIRRYPVGDTMRKANHHLSKTYLNLRHFIETHKSDLKEWAQIKPPLKWEDVQDVRGFEEPEEDVNPVVDESVESSESLDQGRVPKREDVDERRRRKDAAARKRNAGLKLVLLATYLNHLYDELEAKCVYEAIMRGNYECFLSPHYYVSKFVDGRPLLEPIGDETIAF